MIDKLIEKYKKLQKESYKKYSYYLGQDQSIVLNVTEHYRYECNRYSKFLQDLEKLKQSILNHDDLSINNEIGKIILIDTLIGVDIDE